MPFTFGVAGNYTVNLVVDPSGASVGGGVGGVFGVFDNVVLASGSLTMTAATGSTTNGSVINLSSPTKFQFNTGDTTNGNFAPFFIGTITVHYDGSSNSGDVTLWSGDYLDTTFTLTNDQTPQTLISMTIIPEPGTLLLLGFGIGGLAVAVRAGRQRVR